MTLGQRIQKVRKERNLSQKELGKILGVSGSMIGQYENDLRNPKRETLDSIAEALDVSVSSLRYDGSIRIDTSGKEKTEDMTPEEIRNEIKGISESLKKFGDAVLDAFVDGNELILFHYNNLNHSGRKEAIKRTQELARLPEYTEPDEE